MPPGGAPQIGGEQGINAETAGDIADAQMQGEGVFDGDAGEDESDAPSTDAAPDSGSPDAGGSQPEPDDEQ